MPVILTGDRLVVGLSLNTSVGQAAQVVGYLLGAAIAVTNPTAALLFNAATFGVSALIVRLGVRDRPSAMTAEHRSHLLRETGAGFRIVFGTPVLRAIAVLVFSSMLFAIVPEGLAAAWAGERAGDGMDAGTAQAVIMAANPVGFILGGLIIGRAVRPAVRVALIRPFAVLAPLILVPALLDPPPAVVALLAAVCGFAVAGLLPVANGLFVRRCRRLPGAGVRRDGDRRPGDPGAGGAGHRLARRVVRHSVRGRGLERRGRRAADAGHGGPLAQSGRLRGAMAAARAGGKPQRTAALLPVRRRHPGRGPGERAPGRQWPAQPRGDLTRPDRRGPAVTQPAGPPPPPRGSPGRTPGRMER
jgi:hypothetical protein